MKIKEKSSHSVNKPTQAKPFLPYRSYTGAASASTRKTCYS